MEDVGEFNGVMKLFKFWRLNGLRIRILPTFYSGSTDRSVHQIQIASFADSTYDANPITDVPSPEVMQQQMDYKAYTSKFPIKRFYNLRKFYQSRATAWLARTSFYPEACTVIRAECGGFSNGNKIATLELCWYMASKGASTTAQSTE